MKLTQVEETKSGRWRNKDAISGWRKERRA